MRLRLASLAALACLLAAAADARPADEPRGPTLVVRLASIDDLIADLRFLAESAGQKDAAEQGEGFLKALIGPKGLEGIDTKKPIGLYGKVGPNGFDSEGVLLVPVADQKALLDLLERVNVTVKEEKGGLFKADIPNVPLPAYFRFANGYLYATVREEAAIARDRLLRPADVLGDAGPMVGVTLDLDAIPANLKEMVLTQIDLGLAMAREKGPPKESPAEKGFRLALLDEAQALAKSVLREGGKLALGLAVDRRAEELSLTARFGGKRGTELARRIDRLGAGRSLAEALRGRDSAMHMGATLALSDALRGAFGPVVDEIIAKALDNAKNPGEREVGQIVARALTPTLKAAELDAAMDLRGPTRRGLYAAVIGLKVKDGAAIERAMKEAVAKAPEADRKQVKLNFDRAGAVNIHRLETAGADADTRRMFGDGPLFFAVRDDAVLLVLGDDALAVLKEALEAAPKQGAAVRFEVAMGRIMPLVPASDRKAATTAAKAVFKGGDDDRMSLTLEGGAELKLRAAMKAKLIGFFVRLEEEKKKGL
jgi:hypothetical protein